MNERLTKLRTALEEASLDSALLTSGVAIRYFTGFTSDEATVLVTRQRCLLFTDFRYFIQVREQCGQEVELTEITRSNAIPKLTEAFLANSLKRCGYEQDAVSVAQFELYSRLPAELKRFGDELTKLRLIKTQDEIESMQRAQEISEAGYKAFLERIHPGMTEKEAAAELVYQCALAGSEGPSFDPIIGSGPNGAMCHAVPGERKLSKGDLVVVDFGCRFNGYCSDTTRTIAIGSVSPKLKRVYDIVLEAHLKALEALKPGVTGRELDAVARDYIASFGYGEEFGHSLGHGVGLLIHEAPNASMTCDTVFQPGMTITIEPGIYLEGEGGVRTEDCCVVTPGGYRDFNRLSKELIIL